MEENFKKAIAPLQEAAEEKLKDPYLRVFVLSALVWNYQVFLYIFSDLSPDTKFALIQRSLNKWSYIVPIGMSFFYNLFFPIIFYFFYKWADGLNIWVRNAREKELLNLTTHKEQIKDLIYQRDQLNRDLLNKSEDFVRLEEKHKTNVRDIEREYQEQISLLEMNLQQLDQKLLEADQSFKRINNTPAQKAYEYLKSRNLLNEYIFFVQSAANSTSIPFTHVPKSLVEPLTTYKLLQNVHSFEGRRVSLTDLAMQVMQIANDNAALETE